MGDIYEGNFPEDIYICGSYPRYVTTTEKPVCKYQYASTYVRFDRNRGFFGSDVTTKCFACKGECERDYNIEKAKRSKCPFIKGQPMCMMEKCMNFDDANYICKRTC